MLLTALNCHFLSVFFLIFSVNNITLVKLILLQHHFNFVYFPVV